MLFYDNIEEAAENARIFLRRVDAARELERGEFNGRKVIDGGPVAAALKRASMDLTRSLAKIRRNPYQELL